MEQIALMVVLIGGVVWVLPKLFFWLFLEPRQREAILRQGTAAPAVLTSVEWSGNFINSRAECRMEFRVQPEGEAAFRAFMVERVSFTQFSQLQLGQALTVRYLPHDRAKIIIESFDDLRFSPDQAQGAIAASQALLAHLNAPNVGMTARALVHACHLSRVKVGGERVMVQLELRITPKAAPPFEARLLGGPSCTNISPAARFTCVTTPQTRPRSPSIRRR